MSECWNRFSSSSKVGAKLRLGPWGHFFFLVSLKEIPSAFHVANRKFDVPGWFLKKTVDGGHQGKLLRHGCLLDPELWADSLLWLEQVLGSLAGFDRVFWYVRLGPGRGPDQ